MYGSSRRKNTKKVKGKVAEAEWKYLDVNEHWQQMKNIMMETALVTCGLSKGPCNHKETWWNEEVAEPVKEKKNKKAVLSQKMTAQCTFVVQYCYWYDPAIKVRSSDVNKGAWQMLCRNYGLRPAYL